MLSCDFKLKVVPEWNFTIPAKAVSLPLQIGEELKPIATPPLR
jgi:hypothetical protein